MPNHFYSTSIEGFDQLSHFVTVVAERRIHNIILKNKEKQIQISFALPTSNSPSLFFLNQFPPKRHNFRQLVISSK